MAHLALPSARLGDTSKAPNDLEEEGAVCFLIQRILNEVPCFYIFVDTNDHLACYKLGKDLHQYTKKVEMAAEASVSRKMGVS
jgi:hypothetical protein